MELHDIDQKLNNILEKGNIETREELNNFLEHSDQGKNYFDIGNSGTVEIKDKDINDFLNEKTDKINIDFYPHDLDGRLEPNTRDYREMLKESEKQREEEYKEQLKRYRNGNIDDQKMQEITERNRDIFEKLKKEYDKKQEEVEKETKKKEKDVKQNIRKGINECKNANNKLHRFKNLQYIAEDTVDDPTEFFKEEAKLVIDTTKDVGEKIVQVVTGVAGGGSGQQGQQQQAENRNSENGKEKNKDDLGTFDTNVDLDIIINRAKQITAIGNIPMELAKLPYTFYKKNESQER